jgi:hypothetical protein
MCHCLGKTCRCLGNMCHCLGNMCHSLRNTCHSLGNMRHCLGNMCHCLGNICYYLGNMCHCLRNMCHWSYCICCFVVYIVLKITSCSILWKLSAKIIDIIVFNCQLTRKIFMVNNLQQIYPYAHGTINPYLHYFAPITSQRLSIIHKFGYSLSLYKRNVKFDILKKMAVLW